MNEIHKNKITRFLNDETMSDAIYGVLLDSFLKKRGDESTEMKAARFIATELLSEGWKELDKYRAENEENGSTVRQVGL